MKTSQLSNVTDATPKESTADVSGTPFRSRKERRALGKSLREKCPRHLHGMWKPAADRAEPVHLVQQADEGRLPELPAASTRTHGSVAIHVLSWRRAEHGE
ncbi:hypothetical protein ACU4GD_31195 [Cupriavidus basilensis]